ncbi:SCO family protein [Maritimibacter sp. 55A14]|uniref:SCO family protein n=1 Tax=Maritimibacter sp. 55A14 TaxID=2174844 RepID=UPI000D6062A4|nr:SCO family protein [Maritimibacter sp. 55A14]PWE33300.1 SCO family protein [Maritimibacter sp. 55A14]
MRPLALCLSLALVAGAAGAHDSADDHPGPAAADALPFALGGPFRLTDQHGRSRSEADPEGDLQLLFFGYANCPSICSAAMPMMAQTADLLAARGIGVTPVMITVDPARDTPAGMAEPLAELHPDFIGLTGSEDALRRAYDAFQVEHELVFEDPFDGPIYAHGSFVYLLDAAGAVLTLMPPVLTPERAAAIVAGYAERGA